MKKTVFSIIILLFLSANLYSKEFVVGVNPWLNFITYKDGKFDGKTVEVFKKIAKELNYDIKFIILPWARSLQMLKDGKIDAMGNLSYSKKRENFLTFVQPYFYKQRTLFYTLPENTDIIKEYEDLYKYTIPVGLQYTYYEKFDKDTKLNKYIVSNLTDNMPELITINMLLKKRVKVIISSSGAMDYLLKKHKHEGMIKPTLYNPHIFDNLYLGVSNKSPFIKDIDKINEVMKKIINK